MNNDRHKLIWSSPPAPSSLPALPPEVTRQFIPTPLGQLELLVAQPSTSRPRKKALLFQHGGFGFAAEWIPFMVYFSSKGFPCYALSFRGHGASWKPSFLRMVWGYGKKDLSADLGYAFAFIHGAENALREGAGGFGNEDLVLLGHSSGGGICQYFLGKGLGQVGGLVICAGIPSFGGWRVYWNWFKLDPWFAPRYYIRDLWHPRSPLSSTTLVYRAFFSTNFPLKNVREFETQMPEFESMIWPLGMMLPFVNVRGVVRNVLGWGQGAKRILVVAGENDKLMDVGLMAKLSRVYEKVVRKVGVRSLDAKGKGEENDGGVALEVVSNSGHHFQNDLNWEEGARKIEGFLEQL